MKTPLAAVAVCALLLAGCTATTPVPEPDSPSPQAQPTCPDGLEEALEAHLVTLPLGNQMPESADVVEFPETSRLASPLVESVVGCWFVTETSFAGGERMAQAFGISDVPESDLIDAFVEAGWEQPFPETEPNTWVSPDDPGENASLYVGGDSPRPALVFAGWADYLDPDQVLLLTGIGM